MHYYFFMLNLIKKKLIFFTVYKDYLCCFIMTMYCEHGMRCKKQNDLGHVKTYIHDETKREACGFGEDCHNHFPNHPQHFHHPDGWEAKERLCCAFGEECYNTSPQHAMTWRHDNGADEVDADGIVMMHCFNDIAETNSSAFAYLKQHRNNPKRRISPRKNGWIQNKFPARRARSDGVPSCVNGSTCVKLAWIDKHFMQHEGDDVYLYRAWLLFNPEPVQSPAQVEEVKTEKVETEEVETKEVKPKSKIVSAADACPKGHSCNKHPYDEDHMEEHGRKYLLRWLRTFKNFQSKLETNQFKALQLVEQMRSVLSQEDA